MELQFTNNARKLISEYNSENIFLLFLQKMKNIFDDENEVFKRIRVNIFEENNNELIAISVVSISKKTTVGNIDTYFYMSSVSLIDGDLEVIRYFKMPFNEFCSYAKIMSCRCLRGDTLKSNIEFAKEVLYKKDRFSLIQLENENNTVLES